MMNIEKINQLLKSPWNKVYWFARNLINTDKYGGIGSDSKLIAKLSSSLKDIVDNKNDANEKDLLDLAKDTMKNILEERFQNARTRLSRVKLLLSNLYEEINSLDDLQVFILTCENIMLSVNDAIHNIPSNDKDFTEDFAKTYLDAHGENGLSDVINLWDDLGVKGCLTAERNEIINAFGVLRVLLQGNYGINDKDKDMVLTAFVQEFERRAGQKRKGRAGGSLENVTTFILQYFNIPSCSEPEHFQADIEIDKWVKTRDGWLIGISCKRTLRERWKQVSSADQNTLSKYRIKHIYHLITYDEDLSDDKITLLGGQRHIFYLRDDSRIFVHASSHVGLKDYVRPMTLFIQDLRKQI